MRRWDFTSGAGEDLSWFFESFLIEFYTHRVGVAFPQPAGSYPTGPTEKIPVGEFFYK